MQKVLLDTDIGSDIDDALCLAYLLAHPECDLLGITTVSGEAVRRAMMASALCKLAGRDIPIYPGTENPLLVRARQPGAPQAQALAGWEHTTQFPERKAVSFLSETIRRHPDEITLLAIGPLTNIALLFSLEPDIPALLKGLVMMGGNFAGDFVHHGKQQEWNIVCDPHAAAIVYRTPLPRHRSVGLNVTLQVKLDAGQARERFTSQLLQPVKAFAEVWFKSSDKVIFHDPLAAACIFDDAICKFETGHVEVELRDAAAEGTTLFKRGDGPHEVATSVDPARFIDDYFTTLDG